MTQIQANSINRRGYAAIALENPKKGENIGGALRAAGVYGAGLVVVGGQRPRNIRHCTDTMKAWRHIPSLVVDDVFDAIPFDCVPIAVDLLPDAVPLPGFKHPPRAFYVFGAEDAMLGKRITERCAHSVVIPTSRCMNLAATVNVVLYDRLAKQATKQ